MTTKEYLEQVSDIEYRLRSLEAELKDCEKEEDFEFRDKLRSDILSDKEHRKELKLNIRREIQSIPNNIYATLLTEKYIRGSTWEQVADAVGYDKGHVRKELHQKALKCFEEIVLKKHCLSP